ncbi:hypothetical protein BGX21_009941 [Mortierella sp. AD011]|nr:hypothetical protein BGX21_009941 [Mortierella sp. AD011]
MPITNNFNGSLEALPMSPCMGGSLGFDVQFLSTSSLKSNENHSYDFLHDEASLEDHETSSRLQEAGCRERPHGYKAVAVEIPETDSIASHIKVFGSANPTRSIGLKKLGVRDMVRKYKNVDGRAVSSAKMMREVISKVGGIARNDDDRVGVIRESVRVIKDAKKSLEVIVFGLFTSFLIVLLKHTMFRTFLVRSSQPQRLVRSFVPSSQQGIRFISTSGHPEGKECYIERLSGADEGIAIVNFNRPKAFNALSRKFVREFRDALQELRYDQ